MQFPLICLCPWLQMSMGIKGSDTFNTLWVVGVITPTTHPNTNNEPLFSHLLWKITTPTSISLRNLCASSSTFSHGSWWAAMSALTASNSSCSWSCSLVTSSGGRCVCTNPPEGSWPCWTHTTVPTIGSRPAILPTSVTMIIAVRCVTVTQCGNYELMLTQ